MIIESYLGPDDPRSNQGYFKLKDGRYAMVLFDDGKYSIINPMLYCEAGGDLDANVSISPERAKIAESVLANEANMVGRDPCKRLRAELEQKLKYFRANPDLVWLRKVWTKSRQNIYRLQLGTVENINFFNSMLRELGVPVLS